MKQGLDVSASGLVDDAPRRRRKPFLLRRKVQRRVLPWVVIILLFVLWEIVVRVFGIEQFLLPAPSANPPSESPIPIGIVAVTFASLRSTRTSA